MQNPFPLRLTTLFQGTVPKDVQAPEANEDKLLACDARQRYVLSDGATVSYNSLLWAQVLVDRWLTHPPRRNVVRWLRQAIACFERNCDKENLSWSRAAAFSQGSFATLLGIELRGEGEVCVTAVGDTLAILVIDDTIRWSFPYTSAEQFRARPHLLSTVLEKNRTPFLEDALHSLRQDRDEGPCHAKVPFGMRAEERLLCATDALGEWLLCSGPERSDRLSQILQVTTQIQFDALVEGARSSNSMRRDDTTLLILGDAARANS